MNIEQVIKELSRLRDTNGNSTSRYVMLDSCIQTIKTQTDDYNNLKQSVKEFQKYATALTQLYQHV